MNNKEIEDSKIKKHSLFIYPGDEWILDIDCYFAILDKINKKTSNLIEINLKEYKRIIDAFFELCTELNRIIPMARTDLNDADGILELKIFFNFLLDDYRILFKKHKDFLLGINFIRNKYEHAPHTIKMKEYEGTKETKKIEFVYLVRQEKLGVSFSQGLFSVNTKDIVCLVMDLNKIFKKIKEQFYLTVEKRRYDLRSKYFSSIVNFKEEKYNQVLLEKSKGA